MSTSNPNSEGERTSIISKLKHTFKFKYITSFYLVRLFLVVKEGKVLTSIILKYLPYNAKMSWGRKKGVQSVCVCVWVFVRDRWWGSEQVSNKTKLAQRRGIEGWVQAQNGHPRPLAIKEELSPLSFTGTQEILPTVCVCVCVISHSLFNLWQEDMGWQKHYLDKLSRFFQIRNLLLRQALAECLGTLILVVSACLCVEA